MRVKTVCSLDLNSWKGLHFTLRRGLERFRFSVHGRGFERKTVCIFVRRLLLGAGWSWHYVNVGSRRSVASVPCIRTEWDRTHCTRGEMPGGVRLKSDRGPDWDGSWDIGAFGERQSGFFRGEEHEPRTVWDEQSNHGDLLWSGKHASLI